MRNAKVAAFIYEFLYDIYHLMKEEKGHYLIPDKDGVKYEAFFHSFMGCWEGSTHILEKAGVLKRLEIPRLNSSTGSMEWSNLHSPYFVPLMSLDECRDTDFSAFETFDNYCYAMNKFEYCLSTNPECIERHWSPQFPSSIGMEDDIFVHDGAGSFRFDNNRFNEKLAGWYELEVREFRAKPADSND